MTEKLTANYITINIGNTNLSIARSDEKKIYNSFDNYQTLLKELTKWVGLQSPFYLLVCSVVSTDDFKTRYPEVFTLVEKFKSQKTQNYLEYQNLRLDSSFLGMKTNYAKTLGYDRLIQSYNLWKKLISEKIATGLLIDAGTMTTVDILSATNGHLGGYIYPGINSYAQIFQLSKKLPSQLNLIDSLKSRIPEKLPATTVEAISFGYWHNQVNHIQTLIKKYSIEKIIISGGDGKNWQDQLDSQKISQIKTCTFNTLFPHESLWQIGEDVLK